MYAKIINGQLIYSSYQMELEINGKIETVNNPLESDLLVNGFKPYRVENVDVKVNDFEEFENEIVVYQQNYKPSVYDMFDAQLLKNQLFAYYMPNTKKVKEFTGLMAEFLGNKNYKAFQSLNIFLYYAVKQGEALKEDYDTLKEFLLQQNIDLNNLQK